MVNPNGRPIVRKCSMLSIYIYTHTHTRTHTHTHTHTHIYIYIYIYTTRKISFHVVISTSVIKNRCNKSYDGIFENKSNFFNPAMTVL